MPRQKEGHRIVTVVVPDELAGQMDKLAKNLGRSFTAEAIHAFQRHVKTPPGPMPTADLPAEDAQPGPPPKKRGRKPKPKDVT